MNLAERIQAIARQDPALQVVSELIGATETRVCSQAKVAAMSTAPFVVESTEISLAWFRGRTVSIAFQVQDAEPGPRLIPRWFEYYQQDSEQSRFDRAINELRVERRTRLSIGGPSRYSGRGCFSIRQRTEKPTNSTPHKPLETRPEKFDGPVISIWHQPDHLVFDKNPAETQKQFEARVSATPRYTGEHVVFLGGTLVPANEIYSQGENRVSVHGEEVALTDFWAVEYASGWRGFVDIRIHLSDGDRERDEFFEPTEQQMSVWRKKYANGGGFKKKVHPRFRRTNHKWLFRNRIPPITYSGISGFGGNKPKNPDVAWIATRTSARRDGQGLGF